jgi:hypothetical protein
MLQVAADIYNSILCLGALLNLIKAYQKVSKWNLWELFNGIIG